VKDLVCREVVVGRGSSYAEELPAMIENRLEGTGEEYEEKNPDWKHSFSDIVCGVLRSHSLFHCRPPTPLFTARNHDTEVHELRVEVFDSENNSVLDETYELAPDERISHPKSFRFRVPGFEIMDYTFKFTLDGRITETYSTSVRPWNTVEVELYADYAEGRPLSVGEITV